MCKVIPVSAVIATRNRAAALDRTMRSLADQEVHPAEIIIIDASDGGDNEQKAIAGLESIVLWRQAATVGAAAQRNQGSAAASCSVVWFLDDDVTFEPTCLLQLWKALHADPALGGVNAMITNQKYRAPGALGSIVFRLIAGENRGSLAGRVVGPAVNVLPEDRDDLPEVVPVEWLNTTCTFYRREALPDPPFPTHFTGYSLMEDVALSVIVAKSWKLANVRTARIYHDLQPGEHKANPRRLAEMELLNRHYVMTKVLGRTGLVDYMKLALYEIFAIAAGMQFSNYAVPLGPVVLGKVDALRALVAGQK